MNTDIDFAAARLLLDYPLISKGYDMKGTPVTVSPLIRRHLPDRVYYPRPTIAETIMWIYTEHKIWIGVNEFSHGGGCRGFEYVINGRENSRNHLVFESPTEAALAGIKHVLMNSSHYSYGPV